MNVRPLAVVIFLAFGSTFFARFKTKMLMIIDNHKYLATLIWITKVTLGSFVNLHVFLHLKFS